MPADDCNIEGSEHAAEGTKTSSRQVEDRSAPSATEISDALVLQARELLSLAATLHTASAVSEEDSFNLITDTFQSRRMFFQSNRVIEPDTRELARNTYQARRLREAIFMDSSLFGEPAWDILLDLANAAFSGARVSVSSACIGACAPSTTALRWLSILERAGLVEREDDLLDGRRTYVRLSRRGREKMEEYLRCVIDL